jgi:hypothetical protein
VAHTKVPGNTQVPVVLIDVDGVLSLYGRNLDIRHGGRWLNVDGILHFLSESAAEPLLRLASDFDCVWCTGWEDRADEYLRPHYGLPRPLTHLTFSSAPAGAHWKLGAIDAAFGPSRPLAWIDDTLDAGCRAWARDRPGPTLLVDTEPPVGLRPEHAERIAGWAAAIVDAPAT